jgi:putative inorganic carbon (hco3(-)) transporter
LSRNGLLLSELGATPPAGAARRSVAWLDRWHWLSLLLAAPLLLFPTPERSPALLVVPGLWLLAWLAHGRPLPSTPFNGALLLLAVMLLVSLYATYNLEVSLPKLAGMVLALGVFFAAARISAQRTWAMTLLLYVAGGLALAGVSLVGSDWRNKYAFLARLTNQLPVGLRGLPGAEDGFDPNQVAGTLLWVAPLAVALVVYAWRQRAWLADNLGVRAARAWRILAGLSALATCAVLALTQSRAALASLALTLGLMAVVVLRGRLGKRAWLLLGLALAAGGLLALTVGRGVLLSELERAGVVAIDDSGLGLGTGRGRMETWARSLDAAQIFPVTGMGMNTFRTAMPALFPFWSLEAALTLSHAHNEFLQAALDLGLPGLAAFLALHVIAARALWDIASRQTDGRAWPGHLRRWLALGLGSGLLAHFLFGLVDAVALGAKTGVFFWLLLGLIASLHRQLSQSQQI